MLRQTSSRLFIAAQIKKEATIEAVQPAFAGMFCTVTLPQPLYLQKAAANVLALLQDYANVRHHPSKTVRANDDGIGGSPEREPSKEFSGADETAYTPVRRTR